MKAKWIGVVTKQTGAMLYALAALLVVSLPCRAQQPNVEQLRAAGASLTADSAKRGENASFQACQANGAYGLCVTFPGVDASDLAQRIYTDESFAKEMARQGFGNVLIRNTTTDKKLSQNYAMNVSEKGWAANDNYIHDAAENIAVMLAENQHDPAKKVIALKAFLQRYPNSVVRKPILQRLLIALGQTGDREDSIATAKQLLAIVDASDPERVHSLWVVVYNRMLEVNAGTNTDQNLKEAKEYSGIGMRALEQVKKPEKMTDEQFATFKSNASAAFKGAIGAEDVRAAAAKQAVGGNPEANAHSVQAAASNVATSAASGRLSSDQMKTILAAADEEGRGAFSDLVQQTSALPSTLLSIQQQFRQRYPTSGTGFCEEKTSALQHRLGSSLNPKQADDIFEMNQLFMRCAAIYSMFITTRDSNNIYKSVNQALGIERQRQQQIENARTAILQVEGALDQPDYVRANQLFQGLLRVSPLPPFALSYMGQTQSLREDLLAYAQAVEIDHGQNAALTQQLQSLGREVSLLNECGSKRPLTRAYLQHAIKNGTDASRSQLAKLPTFQFDEPSYRIPASISESNELAFIASHIKTIDESLAKMSEVRAIIGQPEAMRTVGDVVGGSEAASLKATADQIVAAERVRGSLVDAQNSLQTKVARKEAAALLTSKESLSGFHLGMTGTQVLAQLKAQSADWRMVPTHPEDPNNNGFIPMGHRWSDFSDPWACSAMRNDDGTDSGMDDCTTDYTFDTLCPGAGRLVMCSTVTKSMEFIFYDPDGGPPWHHDIQPERVAYIGFRNPTDDGREKRSGGKAHVGIFLKYATEAEKRFGRKPQADDGEVWWMSAETFPCPAEPDGKDSRYEYKIRYSEGYVTEVWITLIDRKNLYPASCRAVNAALVPKR